MKTNFTKKNLNLTIATLIILVQLPVIFSHENYLVTWFNIDDGYYYFVTARNIASGLGVTFDGIAKTNGFHPLWMLVITPVFALPGKIISLRVLAAMLIILNAATAVGIFRLASRWLAPGVSLLAALTFAFIPAIHNFTTRGGMEVGLSVFFSVLLLNMLQNAMRLKNPGGILAFSGVACLTFLARLDLIFLVGFVGLAFILRTWQSLDSSPTAKIRHVLKPTLLYFGPIIALLAVYMAYNQLAFGTPTPVSGQVKQWWGTLPNSVYGFPARRLINFVGQFVTNDPDVGPWSLATIPLYAAAGTLGDVFSLGRRVMLALLVGILGTLLGWLFISDRQKSFRDFSDLGLGALFLGCFLQIAYYKISGSVAQRPWYWVNEMLWLVLFGAVVLNVLWRKLAKINIQPVGKQLVAVIATSGLAITLLLPHIPRLGKIFDPDTAAQTSFYYTRSDWFEENTQPGARIGMTGTGSSAYYTDDRIFINLDGLISSYEYFQHLQAGTAADYLTGVGLNYVFGNEYILTESDPYKNIFEGRLQEAAVFTTGDKNLLLWEFTTP